ncbi:MAG: 2Fe-2S iron-sulfur cluster binding domain-containing protein [Sphingobacteriales bacterium]|nr:MAG: 2Fe-2S iron-sulfur cluster binding domain-containing protein [Sphingobacteriales bacterium]
MISFILNEKDLSTELPHGTTLLDLIRYNQQLTGTKIGCREGDCGACTVLVGEIKNNQLTYTSATSCLMAIGNAAGKHIVTIEGINLVNELNTVQKAFSDEGATQCGFCTPGFIVSLTGYCMSDKSCSYDAAIDAVNGNICRCTGYKSIERAAGIVAKKLEERNEQDVLQYAVDNKMIPSYFLEIKSRLSKMQYKEVPPTSSTRFLGGGTDLYVQQHETIVKENVNFLYDKAGLKSIIQKENICELGASVTVADMAASDIFQKHFPKLNDFIKLVSSTPIRNMATIAGNFVNASPIGDLTIFFLALDAKLLLTDGENKREIPLRSFYKGYKNLDKSTGEWIEKIWFELPSPDDHFNFEKVCKRSWLDIASVNTAIYLKLDNDIIKRASIAAGGVGPVPAWLSKSSQWLSGKNTGELDMDELLSIVQAEISPISDVRGTEAYKRLLLSQLIKAHFIVLFPRLQEQIL